ADADPARAADVAARREAAPVAHHEALADVTRVVAARSDERAGPDRHVIAEPDALHAEALDLRIVLDDEIASCGDEVRIADAHASTDERQPRNRLHSKARDDPADRHRADLRCELEADAAPARQIRALRALSLFVDELRSD